MTPPTPTAPRFRGNDGIVVRTPLLPLDDLLRWQAAGSIAEQRAFLAALVDRPEVREALFVASPSLWSAIDGWKAAPDSAAGQRVESSLCKYVARMAGRSTPFGLFSAVSPGRLGKATHLELAPRSEYRRRTRLDNDYLFLLVGELLRAPEVRAALTWKPNTSIYRIAGRLRYAAARLEGKERSYHLVSVEPTDYLDATLASAAGGAKLAALAAALVGDDISLDDARGYIDELVEAQLLVPELGVHVTGPEPIDGMIAQLKAAQLDGPAAILTEVREAIAAIDAAGVGNGPEQYQAIAARLEALPAKVEPGAAVPGRHVQDGLGDDEQGRGRGRAGGAAQLPRISRPAASTASGGTFARDSARAGRPARSRWSRCSTRSRGSASRTARGPARGGLAAAGGPAVPGAGRASARSTGRSATTGCC